MRIAGWSTAVCLSACSVPLAAGQVFGEAPPSSRTPQPPEYRDSLVAGGQVSRIEGAPGGGGASLDWVRTGSNGVSYTAGAAGFQMAGSRWTIIRAGTAVRLSRRVSLSGRGDFGSGTVAETGFHYGAGRGDFHYHVNARMVVRTGAEHFRIGQTRGTLVSGGTLLAVSRRGSLDLSYSASASGNLNTDFIVARTDLNARRRRFFAGGAFGRTAPQLFNLDVGTRSTVKRLSQGFAGLTVPVERFEFTSAVDVLRLESNSRITLSFGIRVPFDLRR